MLKLTTPRLLIILAILIGVFLVVKFTGNKGRSKSFRTELVSVDTAKVTKVEIESPEGITVLTKNEGQWMVDVETGSKKAVNNTVRSMLSTLNSVEPSRLASRTEDKWKDFSVDSAGIRVKVYEGSKLTGDIVLGRFGVEGQRSFYTYVRLSEDKDTYVANNFMKMSISTKPEDFRNSNILRLKKDSLNVISFNYPDSAVVLAKNDDTWYNGTNPADSATTVSYINGLSYVTSKSFVDDATLGTPDLNVTFGFSNQPEIQISAYRRPDGWIISSSENKDELWLDEKQYDKIFAASSKF